MGEDSDRHGLLRRKRTAFGVFRSFWITQESATYTMKLLHLQYLTGVVCLFLSYAVVANATDCQPRNLTASVDDYIRLFIDGVEMIERTTSYNWRIPHTVELPCNATVIGIQGLDWIVRGGILASTDDGYILTNSYWKCTNLHFTGWETTSFDDSAWPRAAVVSAQGILYENVNGIRNDALWIWTKGYNNEDPVVYCRKTLDTTECILDFPDNKCDPSMGKCINSSGSYNCSCYKGYVNSGRTRCEDIDECALGAPINKCGSATGDCVNFPGSYNCSCHKGYRNIDAQSCEVCTSNDLTLLKILGAILGVSVLVNLALLATMLILHSRINRKKVKGGSGVDMKTHQNDIALGDEQNVSNISPVAGQAYQHLNSETLCSNQPDYYETLDNDYQVKI